VPFPTCLLAVRSFVRLKGRKLDEQSPIEKQVSLFNSLIHHNLPAPTFPLVSLLQSPSGWLLLRLHPNPKSPNYSVSRLILAGPFIGFVISAAILACRISSVLPPKIGLKGPLQIRTKPRAEPPHSPPSKTDISKPQVYRAFPFLYQSSTKVAATLVNLRHNLPER